MRGLGEHGRTRAALARPGAAARVERSEHYEPATTSEHKTGALAAVAALDVRELLGVAAARASRCGGRRARGHGHRRRASARVGTPMSCTTAIRMVTGDDAVVGYGGVVIP